MSKLKMVLVVSAVAVAGLLVARNLVARLAFSGVVKAVTGVGAEVDRLNIGLFNGRLGVTGLKVLNPRGFPERVMMSVPDFYAEYDAASFFRGKPHLRKVRIHIEELAVVKNAQGRVNVHSLTPVREQRTESQAVSQRKAQQTELQIDVLELQVGRVVYKDYSVPGIPQVITFNVNIKDRFERITNSRAIVSAILVKSLAPTSIARLVNLDLETLKGVAMQGILGTATGLLGTMTGITEEGTTAVKESTSALKSLIFGPAPAESQPK